MANQPKIDPVTGKAIVDSRPDNVLERIKAIPEANLPTSPARERRGFRKGTKLTFLFFSLFSICGSILGAAWLSQEFAPPVSGFNRGLQYLVKQLLVKVVELEKKRGVIDGSAIGEASNTSGNE